MSQETQKEIQKQTQEEIQKETQHETLNNIRKYFFEKIDTVNKDKIKDKIKFYFGKKLSEELKYEFCKEISEKYFISNYNYARHDARLEHIVIHFT